MTDYAAARLNMVESQLRTNKVTDEALLAAFLAVPRERFVPPAWRATAYVDERIPLGRGRFLLQPMMLARLIQLAEINAQDSVLEIGCATGYGTAVLARVARRVVAVESDKGLAEQARMRLRELGVANAMIVDAPLAAGCPAEAPFDVILFEGALADLPDGMSRQLAEGGRLVAVLREPGGIGRAVLATRTGEVLSRRPSFDAASPLLPGFERAPSFVF